MKKSFNTVCYVLSVVLLMGSCTKGDKPNIVFILIDDLGWSDLPCYGNNFNEAPNIDQLAADGIRFTDAYAACPVCSPTRASIQSGQYPARVGVTDFITGHWRPFEETIVPKNRTQFLPTQIVTLAESLKGADYRTAYFGKWHLGREKGQTPGDQGYDVFHEYAGGGFYSPRFLPPLNEPNEGRLSEILTDLSIDFIDENKDDAFFLFLAHYDVHVQLDADQNLIGKYLAKPKADDYPSNAVYAAMIEHVDKSVGRIVQKLETCGISENTMLIFYSDNGGLVSRFDKIPLLAEGSLAVYEDSPLKYIATSNAPLRAEKGTVYEGGIREPLIIKWPAKIKSGSVNPTLVSSVDFYPTFLEIAGLSGPQDQVLDGISLLPTILQNGLDMDRTLFWHYPVYHHDVPSGAIRKGEWKLIENQVDNSLALYNLQYDLSESNNLIDQNPDVVDELYKALKNWQREVKAEFPIPNPNFNPEKRQEWGRHPDRK